MFICQYIPYRLLRRNPLESLHSRLGERKRPIGDFPVTIQEQEMCIGAVGKKHLPAEHNEPKRRKGAANCVNIMLNVSFKTLTNLKKRVYCNHWPQILRKFLKFLGILGIKEHVLWYNIPIHDTHNLLYVHQSELSVH